LDLMITSVDVVEGEETYFSYFRTKSKGAYNKVLLRAAMEATMSAPTYWKSLDRFVDGGTTAYNNPSLAAIMEATQYSFDKGRGSIGKAPYDTKRLSVFSFGTGSGQRFVNLKKVQNPKPPVVAFWLKWLLSAASDDASDMQTDFLCSKVIPELDYRRFQISLDQEAMSKIPDLPFTPISGLRARTLRKLTDADLGNIPLDEVSYFQLIEVVGAAMAQYLTSKDAGRSRNFRADLGDALVTHKGDFELIAKNMSNPDWLDSEPS
jgi:uncharacterized protein